MPSKATWDKDYVESFRREPEGWAVYPPIKSSKLKPGMCGYFDVNGVWQTIVDLSDHEAVKNANLPPVHNVTFSPGNLADNKKWGVRTSAGVQQCDASVVLKGAMLTSHGGPTGVAGAGLTYGYQSSVERGAILLTRGQVTYRQADPNWPLCDWIVENGKEILRRTRKPKRGVWVVTKTYSATERKLTVLSGEGSGVTVGIDANALNNTQRLQASTNWWRAQSDELWNSDQDDGGIVLAMCGIWWKTRWYSSKVKPVKDPKKQKTLDAETGDLILRPYDLKIDVPDTEMANNEDDAVRVEPEIWGEVEGVEIGDEEGEEEENEDDD